jgi:type VI secretion system protein ImpC
MFFDGNYMKFDLAFNKSRASKPRDPETPFRILVVGELGGQSGRGVVQPVDVDDLDGLLKRSRAAVQLDLQPGAAVPLSIEFNGMDDLHPDQLFERLDLFAHLRQVRQRLFDPAACAAAAREVRAWAGGASPAAPPPPSSAPESEAASLERLLGRAPAPAPETGGAATELIRKLVAPHVVLAPAADQAALVAAVDSAAAELMRRVLHEPAFQALEATWRGIDFLARQLETGEALKICLLNLSQAELAADLLASDDWQKSALFRALVQDTVQSPGAEPWALLLGLFSFELAPADMAVIARLATLAQAAGAPFVAAAGADLVQTVLQNPERLGADKEWAALRNRPEAAYIGLACPRFLLRLPYGESTDGISAFNFEEFAGQPETAGYVWGNPALALGVLLGQMFAESGWEMSLGAGLELGGLPVHTWKKGQESQVTPCAETWLNETQAERLLEHGLMPFQSIRGRDVIRLARVQSIRQPLSPLAGL